MALVNWGDHDGCGEPGMEYVDLFVESDKGYEENTSVDDDVQ
jgi:hypothetical protein